MAKIRMSLVGLVLLAGLSGCDTGSKSAGANSALIVGEWYCRDSGNYIHKQEYQADGRYFTYDSGPVVDVIDEDMPLTAAGSYELSGNVLRTLVRTTSGHESSSVVKVTELTEDRLVRHWQVSNRVEECFKSDE